MTIATPKGNNATLTAEAVAAGRWRLWQQWWQQKQWDNNYGNNQQQRLQAAALKMAGADNNQQKEAAEAAKKVVIAAAGAERGRLWQRQHLRCGGSGGGGCDDSRGRHQSIKKAAGVAKMAWQQREQIGSGCGGISG
jgi:hypothetical protein